MLQFMLDTDFCIRVLRERPALAGERFKAGTGSLAISTIVLTELLFGAANSNRPDHHRALVDSLTSRLVVEVFDQAAADHAADIRLDLSRRGTPIGPNDLLIAGHARSRGLKLVTGNMRKFGRVDGLRCENWLQEG